MHQIDGSTVPLVYRKVGWGFSDLKVDDSLGTLADDVAQIGTTIFVVDVIVQDVLANVLLPRVVESFQHRVKGTFKSRRVGFEVGLHHVNACKEARIIALAVGDHESLDAVADRHAANEAVVHGVHVVEEVALGFGILGVFPAQKLGEVGVRVGVHQLVLLGDELHFLV